MTKAQLARIGDFCEQDRITVRPGEGDELRYIGLETIESGTGVFLSGEHPKTPEVPQANSFRFGSQHVLYGKLRPYLNKVALPDFEGKCSTEIIPLRPRAGLDRRYLYFFLRSGGIVDRISNRTAGARMPRADMDFVLDLQIPLPPLDEQRRIVDLLSRAEGIIRLRREAKVKAAEIVPALFLDMFGDPSRNPKNWQMVTVGDLAQYTRYGPRFPDRRYAMDGAHILRTTDMSFDGELDPERSPVLPVTRDEIAKYAVKPGTLLITRTGATIGKTAIFRGAPRPCIAGAYLIELGVNDRVIPEYVLRFLLGEFGQKQLSRGSRAVAQPNINAPAICAIPIPLPPYQLQLRFASVVEQLRALERLRETATAIAEAAFISELSRFFSPDSIPTGVRGSADSIAAA